MSTASAASRTWPRMKLLSRERSRATISVNREALAGMVRGAGGGRAARASILGRRTDAKDIVGPGAADASCGDERRTTHRPWSFTPRQRHSRRDRLRWL